jgi:hypothetical protein
VSEYEVRCGVCGSTDLPDAHAEVSGTVADRWAHALSDDNLANNLKRCAADPRYRERHDVEALMLEAARRLQGRA